MITIKYTGRYDDRLNFIDDKDNFVGWDDSQQCCEDHFWGVYLDAAGTKPVSDEEEELSRCSFNTNVKPYMLEDDSEHVKEGGGVMVFELINADNEPRFLLVGNDHNGYYSHDWEYSINGNKESGSL